MIDFIKNMDSSWIVTAFIGMVSAIGWLFRLEARANRNKEQVSICFKKLEKYQEKTEDRLSTLYEDMIELDKLASRTSDTLVRIENQLKEFTDFVTREGFEQLKKDLARELLFQLREIKNG